MFTLKTDISQFKKNPTTDKKYKVLLNAGGRCIWICNNISHEPLR